MSGTPGLYWRRARADQRAEAPARPGLELRERGPVGRQEVRLGFRAQDRLAEVERELLVRLDRVVARPVDRDLLRAEAEVDRGRVDDQRAETVADDCDRRVTRSGDRHLAASVLSSRAHFQRRLRRRRLEVVQVEPVQHQFEERPDLPGAGPDGGASGGRAAPRRRSAGRPSGESTYPSSTRSATMRCAARSVMPTRSAMSRIRISGSLAMQSRTAAWFVTKVHGRACEDVLDITKRKSYVPRSYPERETHCRERDISDTDWEKFGGTRLIAGYVAVTAFLIVAIGTSISIGSDRHAEPAIGGFYSSTSACLGNEFKLQQSGQFVDLSGPSTGKLRLQSGNLHGHGALRRRRHRSGRPRRSPAKARPPQFSGTVGSEHGDRQVRRGAARARGLRQDAAEADRRGDVRPADARDRGGAPRRAARRRGHREARASRA